MVCGHMLVFARTRAIVTRQPELIDMFKSHTEFVRNIWQSQKFVLSLQPNLKLWQRENNFP